MTTLQRRELRGAPARDSVSQLSHIALERIGLKPVLSMPRIEALLKRLPADDHSAWCARVLEAPPETDLWRSFEEALLVHETYFFRHPDQLQCLSRQILPRLIEERIDTGNRQLRIWCGGCSSGEEVYTLALILGAVIAQCPVPDMRSWNITILGTDLSAQVLELARAGCYALSAGLNSFRDVPQFARHHFDAIFGGAGNTWSASADLRRPIRFLQHNLVTQPAPLQDLDLIVCRNTLIYFDEDKTRAALKSMKAALRPSGALLLGPADMLKDGSGFAMVCSERAVYWKKLAGPAP